MRLTFYQSSILILFLIFFQRPCAAQDASEKKYEFGLRIAPEIAWVSPNSKVVSSNGSDLNYNFGLMANYMFNPKYSFGFEVVVLNMLSKIKLSPMDVNYKSTPYPNSILTFNYNMQYLQVPLLFKMRTSERNKLRVYGEFGLGLAFLLKARADVDFSGNNISNMNPNKPEGSDNIEVKDPSSGSNYSYQINSLRASFIIGGGIHYNIYEGTMLMTGLRFDSGLTDFLDDDKWDANNSYVALNVGVIF